jgi:hypothetical protein
VENEQVQYVQVARFKTHVNKRTAEQPKVEEEEKKEVETPGAVEEATTVEQEGRCTRTSFVLTCDSQAH